MLTAALAERVAASARCSTSYSAHSNGIAPLTVIGRFHRHKGAAIARRSPIVPCQVS